MWSILRIDGLGAHCIQGLDGRVLLLRNCDVAPADLDDDRVISTIVDQRDEVISQLPSIQRYAFDL